MATYTVKQNDTLVQIAKRLEISTSSLLAANPGVSSITPGVTLRVPTASPRPPFGAGDLAPPPTVSPTRGPTKPPRPPIWEPPRVGPPTGPPPTGTRPPPPQYIPPPVSPRPPVSAGRLAPPPGVRPPIQQPRADLSRYNEARRAGYIPPAVQQVPPGVGLGAGVIPGTFSGQQVEQFGQTTFPYISGRIQNYLDRIYQRYAPAFRGALTRGAENLEATPPLYTPPGYEGPPPGSFNLPAMALRGIASRVGVTAPGQRQPTEPIVDVTGAGRAQALQVGTTQEVDPSTGVIWYRMTLADGTDSKMLGFGMSTEDVGPDGQLTGDAIDKYEQQRADHVGISWMRGEIPQIVLESDRLILGMSKERMDEIGYFWNEDKNLWEYGQQIEGPQLTGAAMPYSGWGYGGYGSGGRGRGYPSYSYPSGGGGTYKPYQPYQNLVRPDAQGRAPQQIQNRPGRFGMITWRI